MVPPPALALGLQLRCSMKRNLRLSAFLFSFAALSLLGCGKSPDQSGAPVKPTDEPGMFRGEQTEATVSIDEKEFTSHHRSLNARRGLPDTLLEITGTSSVFQQDVELDLPRDRYPKVLKPEAGKCEAYVETSFTANKKILIAIRLPNGSRFSDWEQCVSFVAEAQTHLELEFKNVPYLQSSAKAGQRLPRAVFVLKTPN